MAKLIARSGKIKKYSVPVRSYKEAKTLQKFQRRLRKYPRSKYGYAIFKRGTEPSLSLFGASKATANDEQLALRKAAKFSGRGRFRLLRSLRHLRDFGLDTYDKIKERGLYTGRGDYVMNNLIEGGRDSMEFSSPNDETQTIVVAHREYLSDVFGPASGAFTNQSLALNPGIADTFPWLAQIACNYEEYEFIQLLFTYRSTVDVSTVSNGQTGTLIMATNYNSNADPFVSKDQMMTYHGSNSSRLTENQIHGVECDPDKNAGSAIKRIRTKPLIPGDDNDQYDQGLFQYAINNCPGVFQNQAVGELWVEYRVRLSKPKIGSGRGESIQTAIIGCTTNQTIALPFGATDLSDVRKGLNSLNMGLVLANNSVQLVFPASVSGVFEIILSLEGSGFTGAPPSILVAGNVSNWADQYGGSANAGASDNPSAQLEAWQSTRTLQILHVRVNQVTGAVNNTVTYNTSPLTAGTITQAYLVVKEINPTFQTSNSNAAPRWFEWNTGNVSTL